MPDDPAEQDRLILEAALNFDEFTVFVQEITNLRLAMSDLKGLFDSFSETRADADNGGNSSDDNRVVPLKKFINHFNNYTEERFSFLKSYILNPYHRDMTFASRVPEIGVDRVRETLEKKCVHHRLSSWVEIATRFALTCFLSVGLLECVVPIGTVRCLTT